ncbi:Uncharacterized protein CGGC5_v010392 [Colletotrichum fructicola Nara gc5]|uniref:NAD-dependent epimerase/dehydratase domain-containing protein n=1 Tax=Colletotrichum fructicola (strain Nara gc5) TaxID=1213859 RepID=A0A7J6IUR7_COLFN|nr:Uncharacterized protein CGGC5_v010392 [Colletotrichum fructicola Nara gc5]KAF5488703.1 Uncharacterized protein CGCF413_v011992 [Colletotrichum fructicola]
MPSQKRIFITGASGHIGSEIIRLALADGHSIRALSRTPESDTKLRSLGAVPVRGDLASLAVLRIESAAADAVLHLATAYVFGGAPYESIRHIDFAAVGVIADGLAGTDKPLVATSGTLIVAADPAGAETDEASPIGPNELHTRMLTETYTLSLQDRGIRVMAVRLAPSVHGRGRSGVAQLMDMGAKAGCITVIDGGGNRTTTVHVDDAARLYLLAAEKGKVGEARVRLPRDITKEQVEKEFGPMMAFFLSVENRASGVKARKELGWEPKGMGVLEDIRQGSYQAVAKALRK